MKHRSDPGVPGTLRYLRMIELRGISQEAFGQRCVPPIDQGQVSLIELGKYWLTVDMAARIAPAVDRELYGRDAFEATLKALRLWLASVRAYGSAKLLREATDYVTRVSSMSPGALYEQPRDTRAEVTPAGEGARRSDAEVRSA